MKTYLSNLIPELQKFSKKLDDITLLTSKHWVVIDEQTSSKTIYIFRSNSELLISKNGIVSKAKWEYIGNSSLLIDIGDESYLFRHGFFDENVLLLKIDNGNEFAYMVNEHIYENNLKSSDKIDQFLKNKYLTGQTASTQSTLNYSKSTPSLPQPKHTMNSIQNVAPKQDPDFVFNQRILQVCLTLLCLIVGIFLGKYCLRNITMENIFKENNAILVFIELIAIWGFFSFGKLLFEKEV